jgi:hypothetical protein
MFQRSVTLFFLFMLIFRSAYFLSAQDSAKARQYIDILSSGKMAGRGYVANGVNKAADYLVKTLKRNGVSDWSGCYYHGFSMPVVTFPSAELRLDGRLLEPGVDYLVDQDWHSGRYKLSAGLQLFKPEDTLRLMKNNLPKPYGVPVIPEAIWKKPAFADAIMRWVEAADASLGRVCLIAVSRLPAWSVGRGELRVGLIRINDSLLRSAQRIDFKLVSKYDPSFATRNVTASVPGTRRPDSLLVLTAHYDHLGRMGKAVFPGANDNASGVALLLDLAAEIAKKPLPYTTVFVFFAGEEAGLLGSEAMLRDRKLPLSHIRFLLNLDLMGSGETGMTVVNATVFKDDFSLLDSLNRQGRYLPEIRKRGKAANSDHYYFTEAGVPSFFWYLSGPRSAYHDVYDIPSTLTLHGYNATFRLVMSFFESLSSAQ